MSNDEEWEEEPIVVRYNSGIRIDEEPEHPDDIAVLWVPDPEQRRGWREYYIKRKPPTPKPGALGFTQRKKR